MSSYFKRIRKKGYLMVGYSLLKALGRRNAIVLERLHTEYQHAIREELLYKGKFGVNLNFIGFYIGFTTDDIVKSMNELIALGLISAEHLKENLYSVRINEEEIYNYEKTKEVENEYKMYDYALHTIQEYAYEIMEKHDEIPFEDLPLTNN